MQLYECTVRLHGSMHNEVRKTDVTAAEIKLLRVIHKTIEAGVDIVHKIKATGHVDRTDAAERDRLAQEYGGGMAAAKITLETLFGHDSIPLPQAVEGVDQLPPPKSGRRARAEQPAAEPEPIEENEFA
jgi:hypothetical protein